MDFNNKSSSLMTSIGSIKSNKLTYDNMKIVNRKLNELRCVLIEADFQRMRRDEMTASIFESMNTIYLKTGKVNILSTLSIAKITDTRENILIDGQHRMCAYVALADKYNIDIDIPVIEFRCTDRAAAFDLFKLINNSNPVTLYSKQDSQIVAAGFIKYIKKRYDIYSKATSNAPRFPNFNIYKLDECLRAYKLIEDNAIALPDELIEAFEALTKYFRNVTIYSLTPWLTTEKGRLDFIEYQKTSVDFPIIGIFGSNLPALFALLDHIIKNIKNSQCPMFGISSIKYRGPATTAKKYNTWLCKDKLNNIMIELFGKTPCTQCYCCGANVDFSGTFIQSEYNPLYSIVSNDIRVVCKQCNTAATLIPLTKYKQLLQPQ